jgi:hypothetical protein
MATSRKPKSRFAICVASLPLLPVALPLLLAASPVSAAANDFAKLRTASRATRPPAATLAGAFSWLHPSRPPAGWVAATIASGNATLFYPPDWKPTAGDPGTVTAALRDNSGVYHGYLNVTPRQGAERLTGWAAFRTGRNREEGDGQVRDLAAAEGLRFRDARGSCVIDEYLSRVRSHPYREIACIVAGRRALSVFVGAALQQDWTALGPLLERAASDFLER